MNVWLVSPAWGRYAVTRLALAQRRWLCDQLALRGLTANPVIVADDENLDIAREFGFDTVELGNADVGAKFNAGYRHAAAQGADVFVHIGSDDWVHPDVFNLLGRTNLGAYEHDPAATAEVWSAGPVIAALRGLTLVDVNSGGARRLRVQNAYGCVPWLLPRALLKRFGFAPIGSGYNRGIDGALIRGTRTAQPNWTFQDGPEQWCVDFKSDTNITAYKAIADSLGVTPADEDPFLVLRDHYPKYLIRQAQQFWAAA